MIGRKNEIAMLQEAMDSEQSEFLALYGRRRVGKTFLVTEFFNGKFAFHHSGLENATLKESLSSFREALRHQGHPHCPRFATWIEAFSELETLLERLPCRRKVVFLDEIPWYDTPKSGFLTAFESFWNGWASVRRDIVLVVCGSATTWIVEKVLRNRGGLHNRITDQIHLMPFTLRECEELVRDSGLSMSRQEICSLYMIFGGVAYYWGFLRKGESVAQSVDRLLFSPNGKLRGEFDSMVASLFKKDAGYRKVFTALAAKGVGMTREELLKKTGLPDGRVFCQILDSLEKCGFVRRYTAFGKKRRDALYQLLDSFSLFHLRFIEPESNPDPNDWAIGISSKAKGAWEGLAFERVCLMHVREIKRALQIGGVRTSVCSWRHVADESYGKGAQIDLLIDRADNVIDVCEMKYSSGKYALSKKDCENIDNKLDAFKAVSNTVKSLHLILITANGLAENAYARKAQNVLVLDDLFA